MSGRAARRSMALLALSLLLLLAGHYIVEREPWAGSGARGFALHVIDVGKADCLLIECDGRYMLVDTGEAESERAIRAYLASQGVTQLDLLVATHPDRDHIGGVPWVVSEYEVARAWLCPLARDTEPYSRMLEALIRADAPIERPMAGATGALGGATIEVLSPNQALLSAGDKNECSLVLRITYGSTRFLLMADAQRDAERYLLDSYSDLSADVLKVGHHGSDKASTGAFLSAVNARWAVISGDDPDADALYRLNSSGAQVLRTDLSGDIVLRSDGNTITASAARRPANAA